MNLSHRFQIVRCFNWSGTLGWQNRRIY